MSASRKLVLPAGRGLKLEQLGLDVRLNLEQKEERIKLQKSMHKRNVLAVTKEEEEDDIRKSLIAQEDGTQKNE